VQIHGSAALVTGANRGLGAVFVEELVARGCKVYACARNIGDLDRMIAKHGGNVLPIELDVTNQSAIVAATARADDVNLLINNAGRLDQLSLGEAGDLSSLKAEMEVNVFGLAQMCLSFAPIIGKNGGGAIVNMLSAASLVPPPHFGSYAASKAAAMSLTHSMRWDFEPAGIDVVGVYAGLIDTDMISNLDMPKTSPEDVVRIAFEGLEAGLLDIAVDDRSAILRKQLHSGIEELLVAGRQRATAIRKSNSNSNR
jgi:NAD(P)-dependent dehydrogenase (short-subunit alcohol dehydrogenase family)